MRILLILMTTNVNTQLMITRPFQVMMRMGDRLGRFRLKVWDLDPMPLVVMRYITLDYNRKVVSNTVMQREEKFIDSIVGEERIILIGMKQHCLTSLQ